MTEQTTSTEEFRAQGEEILAKVKELARQGNVRRISIKSEDGRPIADVPLPLGVLGALLMPRLAALGAVAALLARCVISVERVEEEEL